MGEVRPPPFLRATTAQPYPQDEGEAEQGPEKQGDQILRTRLMITPTTHRAATTVITRLPTPSPEV